MPVIWTSFILIARLSARGHLNPFDIMCLRFVFSGDRAALRGAAPQAAGRPARHQFTQAVKTFGPVRTTMITALVPVLATFLAVPLLGEPVTAAAVIGLVCVTAGLLIGVRAQSAASGR